MSNYYRVSLSNDTLLSLLPIVLNDVHQSSVCHVFRQGRCFESAHVTASRPAKTLRCRPESSLLRRRIFLGTSFLLEQLLVLAKVVLQKLAKSLGLEKFILKGHVAFAFHCFYHAWPSVVVHHVFVCKSVVVRNSCL